MLTFFLSMLETDEERDFFTDLYIRYRQGMFRYANKYLHNDHDAEDIVHDVFCIVADKCIAELMERSDIGRRRFLFICTRNRAVNFGKRKSKVISFEEMAESSPDASAYSADDPIDEIITDKDMLERGKAAICSLDPKYADVLWMHLDGYSVQSIAALWDEKPDTVKKRLYRAKRLLREAVGEKGGELR